MYYLVLYVLSGAVCIVWCRMSWSGAVCMYGLVL
jgi:hypothetical protein